MSQTATGMGFLNADIDQLKEQGLYRPLRIIGSANRPVFTVDGKEVINLSSNNYLGLTTHPKLIAAAVQATEWYGVGSGAVRTIAGTMTLHEELERRLAGFKHTEASLTFQSGFTANTGVLQSMLKEDDVIISDQLNHASIIDGIRLSRAQRKVFPHKDMNGLESALKETQSARVRLVVTDGVFSMEGDLANLPALVELTTRHDALLIVDDSHGLGVLGATGRGTAEHFGLLGRIDVLTGTLGKALGGAAGGFVAASRDIVDYLVQRSRPQLFSNALPPAVLGAAGAALAVLAREPQRVARLHDNAAYIRAGLRALGYRPLDGASAIVPILIGETAAAVAASERLYARGVFVIGFGYPVVPEGAARLRVQVSAAHTREHLDRALAAFAAVRPA